MKNERDKSKMARSNYEAASELSAAPCLENV